MNLKKFELDFSQHNNEYRVIIKDITCEPTQSATLVASVSDFRCAEERRFALDGFFTGLSYILRHRTFPKDTMTYDIVDGAQGKRCCNPRFPDGE